MDHSNYGLPTFDPVTHGNPPDNDSYNASSGGYAATQDQELIQLQRTPCPLSPFLLYDQGGYHINVYVLFLLGSLVYLLVLHGILQTPIPN